ncbi:MAG: hypothetical protein JSS10_04510 [Verrucomicrobia bacterium]|nr:hypothetical protein [Verrucomicrobiota bacterium]
MAKSRTTIFLFGAAERGELCTPIHLASVEQVLDFLGNPPESTEGIRYAVQALLYGQDLIYFRVADEGFSTEDYIQGLRILKQKPFQSPLTAIGMPGVGDEEIIQAAIPICHLHHSILLVNERDLYDYLTAK